MVREIVVPALNALDTLVEPLKTAQPTDPSELVTEIVYGVVVAPATPGTAVTVTAAFVAWQPEHGVVYVGKASAVLARPAVSANTVTAASAARMCFLTSAPPRYCLGDHR